MALVDFLVEPLDWHRDAACREHPPEWWFPGRGELHGRATTVCAGCLVRDECLDFAMHDRDAFEEGIWGGTSARMRRKLRSAQHAA